MFLLNSRLDLFNVTRGKYTYVHTHRAPLLPKLRGQIAEFLNEGFLDHLGTFIPIYQSRFAVRALLLQWQRGFS